MKIYDPLYGEFLVPEIAAQLVLTPEIRRLSQIRLLNSLTPSLATLGEIRRFSHTLGVLHLFSHWKNAHYDQYSKDDLDALEVAILLHDVATPPFGHLFEYLLKEEGGWDHETASSELFRRHHSPANSGDQIFAGQTPKVYRAIQKLCLPHENIEKILQKQHQLHPLIMGSLDFDNIDNVWRMAWALGLTRSCSSAIELASKINVSENGALIVPRSCRGLLQEWALLRKSVYEILVFDPYTVAGQAVLTKALRIAMKDGVVSSEDWTVTDEDLLQTLGKHAATKKLIKQQYLGNLPSPLIFIQLKWKNIPIYGSDRIVIEAALTNFLNNITKGDFLVYVFKEKGSFSKQLTILDEEGVSEMVGETTRSLIVYIFGSESANKKAEKFGNDLIGGMLSIFDSTPDDILKLTGLIADKITNGHLPLFD